MAAPTGQQAGTRSAEFEMRKSHHIFLGVGAVGCLFISRCQADECEYGPYDESSDIFYEFPEP